MAQKEKIPPKDSNAKTDPKVTRVARPPKDRFGKPLEIGENPLEGKEIRAVLDRGDAGSKTIIFSVEELARARIFEPNGNRPKDELAIDPEEVRTAGSNTMSAVAKGVCELGNDGFGRKEKIIGENWDTLGHSFSFAPPQEPAERVESEDAKYARVVHEGTDEHAKEGNVGSRPKKVTLMEEYTDENGEERLRESVIEAPAESSPCVFYTPEQLARIREEALQEQKAGNQLIAEWPQSEGTNYGVEPTAGANCQIFTREEAQKLAKEQGLIPKPPIADPNHTVVFTPDGKGGVVPMQNGKEVRMEEGVALVDKERIVREKEMHRNRIQDKILTVVGWIFMPFMVLGIISQVGLITEQLTGSPNFITNSIKWAASKIIYGKSKAEMYEDNIFESDGNIHEAIAKKSAEIIKGNEGPLHFTQILDIFDWIGLNIMYTNVDKAFEPRKASLTLELRQGDCKNMAALVAAMELSIGARMAVITTGAEEDEYGDRIGHAYTAVRIYKPTLEEQDDPEKKAKRYEEIRNAVRKIIFSGRYSQVGLIMAKVEEKEKPESIETAMIEDPQKEGLWLVLDAVYEENGWPGRERDLEVDKMGREIPREFIKFGEESSRVRGIELK